MSKLTRQLKSESKTLSPSAALKDRVMADAGIVKSKEKAQKSNTFSRKAAWIGSAVAVAAVIIVCVVLATVLVVPDGGKPDDGGKKPVVIGKSTMETYAFGAYSAGLIIQNVGGGAAASLTNGQIDTLGSCMALIDSLMNSEPVMSESVSTRDGYAKMMTVSFEFQSGGGLSYVVYFNEKAEAEADGEVSSRIEGVMVAESAEYKVIGTREKESDGVESEYETEITVYFDDEKTDFVKVRQETENEEGEVENGYAYSIYTGGVLVKSFAVEMETEEGESELELEIFDAATGTIYAKFDYTNPVYSITIYSDEENEIEIATVTVTASSEDYTLSYNGTDTVFRKPAKK